MAILYVVERYENRSEKYNPGDVIEISPEKADFLKRDCPSAFSDEAPKPDTDDIDFSNASIDVVMKAVKDGRLTVDEALEIEGSGKKRKTLIERLLAMRSLDKPPADKAVKGDKVVTK